MAMNETPSPIFSLKIAEPRKCSKLPRNVVIPRLTLQAFVSFTGHGALGGYSHSSFPCLRLHLSTGSQLSPCGCPSGTLIQDIQNHSHLPSIPNPPLLASRFCISVKDSSFHQVPHQVSAPTPLLPSCLLLVIIHDRFQLFNILFMLSGHSHPPIHLSYCLGMSQSFLSCLCDCNYCLTGPQTLHHCYSAKLLFVIE